jgi:hypothetical protein
MRRWWRRTPYYLVVGMDYCLRHRLSIDVMVSDVCLKSEEAVRALTAISSRLYRRYRGRKYERVFICYYLPGMEVGAGAWATGHFNPELEVKVLGKGWQDG